jgi:hypothetical protein
MSRRSSSWAWAAFIPPTCSTSKRYWPAHRKPRREAARGGSLRVRQHREPRKFDALDELERRAAAGRYVLERVSDVEVRGRASGISPGADVESTDLGEPGKDRASALGESRVLDAS